MTAALFTILSPKMRTFGIFFILVPLFLASKEKERFYQLEYAKENKGEVEVIMPDGTRCDIITENYAIEVDFARKWAEAIGQSLNYARLTGKKAGIVLLMGSPNDEMHLIRLNEIILHYRLPITVFPKKIFSNKS